MYNSNLLNHMARFIGQTVTIFTASGGASGCGFTGTLMSVNPCFVRLSTQQGTPPANPISQSKCLRSGEEFASVGRSNMPGPGYFTVGSVCDIPVDKIVSFCHNAI
ncbi:MAG: hypothetical protein GX757_11070 [Clostridiales bacterium]|nr:hypothetical protein [Clostridiales bacterium]